MSPESVTSIEVNDSIFLPQLLVPFQCHLPLWPEPKFPCGSPGDVRAWTSPSLRTPGGHQTFSEGPSFILQMLFTLISSLSCISSCGCFPTCQGHSGGQGASVPLTLATPLSCEPLCLFFLFRSVLLEKGFSMYLRNDEGCPESIRMCNMQNRGIHGWISLDSPRIGVLRFYWTDS